MQRADGSEPSADKLGGHGKEINPLVIKEVSEWSSSESMTATKKL